MSRSNRPAVVVFSALAAGCGGGDAPKLNPVPVQPAPPKPASPWEPDPSIVARLTTPALVGGCQFMLPRGFAPVDTKVRPRPGTVRSKWATTTGGDSSFDVAVMTGPDLVDQAKNMPSLLGSFVTVVEEADGVKVLTRSASQTGRIMGLQFTKVDWKGASIESIEKFRTGVPGDSSSGVVYGAVDGGALLLVNIAAAFNTNAAGNIKTLQAAVTTLTKP